MEFEKRDALVGAAVLAAAAILSGAWWRINRERMIARTYHLQIQLPDIRGVDKGTEAVLRGYKAGAVERIEIVYEPRFQFNVQLAMKQEIRLRQGTQVTVRDKGFGGARYLELIPPPEDRGRGFLSEGARLPVATELDLMAKANEVLAEVQKVVREFQKSGATGEVMGVLTQARTAAAGASALMIRLDAAAANANKLLANLNALVEENRPGLGRAVGRAESAMGRTDDILAKRDEALRQALENIRESTRHLPAILVNVEELTEEVKRRPWRLLRKSEAGEPLKLEHAHPASPAGPKK